MSRDTFKRLADPEIAALHIDGGDWPRSLLTQTPIPDAWMGLVERADGKRRFVPAGEDPRPERDERIVLVRNRLLTVPVDVQDVRANCRNVVAASAEVLVRWQARDDDLAALRRTLLDAAELRLERLARAFGDAGAASALREFIRAHDAAELIHQDRREEFVAALRAQLKRFLFDTGLVIDRVARLQFASDTLAHQEALKREADRRVEHIQARQAVERAALAATQRRLDGLSEIFGKLKSAAGDDSQIQWHDLLPSLSPAERGKLLENLWRITPDRHVTRAIVVVAGNEVLWLDPAKPAEPVRRVTLPDELGGLRSVRFDESGGRLLIGAGHGVWVLKSDDGSVLGQYRVPAAGRPRTGFNATAVVGGRLCATHSQLGCWSWALDDPDDARALLKPSDGIPAAIRGATATRDDRLLVAADDAVIVFDPAGERLDAFDTGGAVIHCLSLLEDMIYVGTASGAILQRRLGEPQAAWVVAHRGTERVESIHVRRWHDLVELVIPAGVMGVCGIYGDEGVITPLLRGAMTVRRAWASDDAVVAMNDRRDRLLVLGAAMPEREGVEVAVSRLTGSSVQDACLVVESCGTDKPGPGGRCADDSATAIDVEDIEPGGDERDATTA